MQAWIAALICVLVSQGSAHSAPAQVDCMVEDCGLRLDVAVDSIHCKPTDELLVTIDLLNASDRPIVLVGPIEDDIDVTFLRENGDPLALRDGNLFTMMEHREVTRNNLITLLPGKSVRARRTLRLNRFSIPGPGQYLVSAQYVPPHVGQLVPERANIWAWEDGAPQAAPVRISIGPSESVTSTGPSN